MADRREIVPTASVGSDGDAVPHELVRDEMLHDLPEEDEDGTQGPDPEYTFWDEQIRAALIYENRWRSEALEAERLYFGPDNDPGKGGDAEAASKQNRITDKTALIHANIDVLRPLIYSDTPQPVARRRFHGDGRKDPVALHAAEVCQRLAEFMVDADGFDIAMEGARDDWLIAGRGQARAIYAAEIGLAEDGKTPVKIKEEVKARPVEWQRLTFAPSTSFEQAPWGAIEVPMTYRKVKERFGEEAAAAMTFDDLGLKQAARGISDEDQDRADMSADSSTGTATPSPFATAPVWEIWVRESQEVVWWSPNHKQGVLDKQPDPLGLERFFPFPRPLLATTKGQQMTPRPDIKYYERRATEIDVATEKMRTILDALSVSGLFPGQMQQEVKKLLSGRNEMVAVSDWVGLIEKGGSSSLIQWLPIEAMIRALQALAQMREQAKDAMFEASGVSDVMRASSDPSETATAQQIKGRYAGLRLSERQKRMAFFARDMLRIMVEIALEHFDLETIAEICQLDLPVTEAERLIMLARQEALQARFQSLMQAHQMIQTQAEQGLYQGPVPPAPEPPEQQHIPEASMQTVVARLRTDWGRKITVQIETQSTVLADEQADKEARIEFLSAFATFVSELAPLAGSGQFDYKTVKELLLFGVRGFPKSRTLESLITSLPDEPQGEPPEDTQVTVAKIKAEADRLLQEMEQKHELELEQLKLRGKVGADLVGKAAETMANPPERQKLAS